MRSSRHSIFGRPGCLLLAVELTVLIAGPVQLMGLSVQLLRFATVFLVAGYCFWRSSVDGVRAVYLRFNLAGCRVALPGILLRWLVGSAAIAGIVLLLDPERLFCIPRADPLLMGTIVSFYGLVSVLPQEIAFRGYVAYRLDNCNVPYLPAMLISAALFG